MIGRGALLAALLVSSNPASAQSQEFDVLALETEHGAKESGAERLLTSNLRWTTDLASRLSASTSGAPLIFENFAGLDAQKIFSGPSGDWGTLTMQFYLTRIDNKAVDPSDDGRSRRLLPLRCYGCHLVNGQNDIIFISC